MFAITFVFVLIEIIVFGVVVFVIFFPLALLYYTLKARWRRWRARRGPGEPPELGGDDHGERQSPDDRLRNPRKPDRPVCRGLFLARP